MQPQPPPSGAGGYMASPGPMHAGASPQQHGGYVPMQQTATPGVYAAPSGAGAPRMAGATPPHMAGAQPYQQQGGFAPQQPGAPQYQGQPQNYPPAGQYAPAGAPPQGQYPPTGAPPHGQYPPTGGPPHGQYPPTGAPPQGQYPPTGAPPHGQYPPTGAPPHGQYPPTGAVPPGQYPPPGAPHQGQGGPPPPQSWQAPPGQGYPAGPPPPGHPGAGGWDPSKAEKMPLPPDDAGDDHQGAVADAPEEGEAPKPSAPPVERMDSIHGYAEVGFEGTSAPPPSYDRIMEGPQPTREPLKNLPVIKSDDAREALLLHVSEHCCYGKGAARNMDFTNINLICAFHYTLETFTELRASAWHSEPYMGTPVDGPQNGRAPGPWEIQCTAPEKFKDQVQHYEVPHTASVKPCHHCLSNGQVWCPTCHGQGRTRCNSCRGSGHRWVHSDGRRQSRRCFSCHGYGTRQCSTCQGGGRIVCPSCQGRCNLKCYIRLTVQWKNHAEDHIVEKTDLPDELVRNVSGQLAFEEENNWVWPINHFPDNAINTASHEIVTKHRTAFVSERTLLQRHRVRIVPVNELHVRHNDKPFRFFVYGFENKIHAPEYPAQCCWGCTIL